MYPMAAAQAMGTRDPFTARHFPEGAWALIEEWLGAYFHSRSGFALARYKSPSQSVEERGIAGSLESKPCTSCKGAGFHAKGMDRSHTCGRCKGAGTVLGEPRILHATAPCKRCHGARVYHPNGKRWPGIRPSELACCVTCRGAGYTHLDAGQGVHTIDFSPKTEQTKRSWLDPPMIELDAIDPRASLVLDMVYGSVGYGLTRYEGEDRMKAIWLLTKWGQEVVTFARVRYRNDAKTLLEEVHDQRAFPNDIRAARLRRAQNTAILLLAKARKSLFAADHATGSRMLLAGMGLASKGAWK